MPALPTEVAGYYGSAFAPAVFDSFGVGDGAGVSGLAARGVKVCVGAGHVVQEDVNVPDRRPVLQEQTLP